MKVGAFNPSPFNRPDTKSVRPNNTNRPEFHMEQQRTEHSQIKRDNLINQFWNLTDSMPRDNQISMAASVVAGRVMDQGITNENEAFIKNISSRFSPAEIDSLKEQVKNHPKLMGKNHVDVNNFFNELDQTITQMQSEQLDKIKEHQVKPQLRTPDEIFFQTTLNPVMPASTH